MAPLEPVQVVAPLEGSRYNAGMAESLPIITLLTDFGDQDGYAGVMKGVILSIAPGVRLIDITHQVQPQDIQQAAHILGSTYRYFPSHTIHVVVVDPGVGGPRRAIALETPRGRFVAPDNGVLTCVLQQEPSWQAVVLDQPAYWLPNPSHTFHGRDIFSPVAAHLANGVPLQQLGSPVENLTLLPQPPLEVLPNAIRGQVIRIDRFGNALTNIMRLRWLDDRTVEFRPLNPSLIPGGALRFDAHKARITFGWHTLNGLRQTYSQVAVGQPAALIGSTDGLEIAVNQGNAADMLAINVGDTVALIFEPIKAA